MDLWATKTPKEREDEEAERLVRPMPTKKPPRHDRHRERMKTDKDPDLDERDPDLSKNYKDIGGSVANRWLAAKTEKIPARKRETGKVVWISPKTLEKEPSKYEKLDPKEAEKAKTKRLQPPPAEPPEKPPPAEPPQKPGAKPAKPGSQAAGDAFREMAKAEPRLKSLFKGFTSPGSDMYGLAKANPDLPAETFLAGVKLPPGIKTIGDVQNALLTKPAKKAPKKKAPAKGKKPAEDKEPEKPSVAEEKGIKEPERRKASEAEYEEARTLIQDVFPPAAAERLSAQNLHPDDVRDMVSSYQEAKYRPIVDPSTYASEIREFYQTDPEKVKPPKTGLNVEGKKVPWDTLTPDDQASPENAELYRKHQLDVVAASVAAEQNLTAEYMMLDKDGQPRIPPGVAAGLAFSMLHKPEPPETVKVGGEDVPFADLDPIQRKRVMKTVEIKTAEALSAQVFEQALDSGKHTPIDDSQVSDLLGKLNPNSQAIARSFLEANDYHRAKEEFVGVEGLSEFMAPQLFVKHLDKASEWFSERADTYGVSTHAVASPFRVKVLSRLRSLDESKYRDVRSLLDKQDAETYKRKQEAWKKRKEAFQRQQKNLPPDERKDFAEDPPVKPVRYGLSRDEKELETAGDALVKRLRKTASRVAQRYVSTYAGCFAMDHFSSPTKPAVREAVYHGIDPGENDRGPYPQWSAPHQRDVGEDDYTLILTHARDWLKTPVLAQNVQGVVKDTQLRAALDLGIKTSGYDRHLHPAQYNLLLARLAGVSEAETLTTQAAESSCPPPMEKAPMNAQHEIRKLAVEVAKSNPSAAFELTEIADRMEPVPPMPEDFWMTREMVASVCSDCAVKMASLNITKVKASAVFGSDLQVLKTAAKWQKLPKGWTDDSLRKMWASLTGDAKHKVTACIKKMGGKVNDPGAFCAAAKDRIEGTTKWRGEREAAAYAQLKSHIIRTAATDAGARRVLMPILQAIKSLDE